MLEETAGSLASLELSEAAESSEDGFPRSARIRGINRKQTLLRVVDVEKLIPEDHPARAIWEITGRLDLSRFYRDIKAVEGVAGRPVYDPRMMICLWIYAYSEEVGAAREIGRLCSHDPAYQWITGFQEINYHSLSDFRIAHRRALDELFVQVLGVLSSEGLIGAERISHDGVKIKSFAGADTFRRQATLQEHLKQAEERVRKLSMPEAEEENPRKAGARLRAARERKERLEAAARELEKICIQRRAVSAKAESRVSTTEPEARVMKHAEGGYAPGYNVQISTDITEGIIVGMRVTNEASDYGELLPSVEEVQENLGVLPKEVLADGGFTSRKNIIMMDKKGVGFIGSFGKTDSIVDGQMERRGVTPEFRPDKFRYDAQRDVYICPAGKSLVLGNKEKRPGQINYVYRAKASDCFACPCKEYCCPTNQTQGRRITRKVDDPVVEAFIKRMETKEAKEIYRQRGRWSEFVNAWIKEKFGLRKFRLCGMGKALVEMLWACLAYNIKQWIRLRWRGSVRVAVC